MLPVRLLYDGMMYICARLALRLTVVGTEAHDEAVRVRERGEVVRLSDPGRGVERGARLDGAAGGGERDGDR